MQQFHTYNTDRNLEKNEKHIATHIVREEEEEEEKITTLPVPAAVAVRTFG